MMREGEQVGRGRVAGSGCGDDAVGGGVDAHEMTVLDRPNAVPPRRYAVEEVGRRAEVDPGNDGVRVRVDAVDGVHAVRGDPDPAVRRR